MSLNRLCTKQNVQCEWDNLGVAKHTVLPEQARNLGAVYTPEHLSQWLISLVKNLGFSPDLILDPAAGDGALLVASERVFPEALGLGIDVDEKAHDSLLQGGWAHGPRPCDALGQVQWFPESGGSRLIFSNPPWGARISKQDSERHKSKYRCAVGSYDIFDVFIERTISELRTGDLAALFLPDSLLLTNHTLSRQIIQENSIIHCLVRLPEGIFPGVSMGSLALIIEKGAPNKNHLIRYSRITRSEYFQSDKRSDTLESLRTRSEVRIPQSEWSLSRAATWQTHSLIGSVRLPSSIINHSSSESGSSWDIWFTSGRGLEMGKKSLIKVRQPVAGSENMKPVAVGEDINRRTVKPSRLIDISKSTNVRTKSELSPTPRLLVRKTGIGIKAAVGSGVITTQSVYHFRPRDSAPDFALHYAAGFLTSRVLIAVHLAKTGETEWRSHPYVTQRVLRDLQLPIPAKDSYGEALAREIATLSEMLHESPDPAMEDELDLLVARILDSDKTLVDWAKDFLSKVTGCSYTRELSEARITDKSA